MAKSHQRNATCTADLNPHHVHVPGIPIPRNTGPMTSRCDAEM